MASAAASTALSPWWISRIGNEPPGVGVGTGELGGVAFHAGEGEVVFEAADAHGQQSAADQVVVGLPARGGFVIAEFVGVGDRWLAGRSARDAEGFVDGVLDAGDDFLVVGHDVLEMGSVDRGEASARACRGGFAG